MGHSKGWLTAGLFAVAALAAQPAEAQMRFGIRAGANFATVTGDDVDQDAADTRTGLVAGGFLEAPLADIVRAHIGAQYSQKGFQSELAGEDAELKLDYFEVPALLAVLVPTNETIDIRLYVGPTFSFLVSCKGDVGGFQADCEDPDGDKQVKSFDLGGEVGAGLAFGMGGGAALLVDGWYNFGFSSIDNTNADLDLKNEVFGVTAGVMFPAGD